MALAAVGTSHPEKEYRMGMIAGRTLPLLVEPDQDADVGRLSAWIAANEDSVHDKMTRHGAMLFRGFDVNGPADFERIARAIDSDLKNEYLGTSPRNALTDYVFSASELPGFYPIPQHCEMTFIAHPPRRIFFTCLVEPAEGSGETPLVDFRTVYRDLPAAVRDRFEQRGVRIVRNYSGPAEAGKRDLWKLKRWDEMFRTTDRDAVEAKCREEGFDPVWGPRDRLRLVSTQPATRTHPTTGEKVWHNHSQVFHLSAGPGEYRRIHGLRPTPKNWFLWRFASVMVGLQKRLRSSDEQSMHCTHIDGGEIAEADMEAVRDAIWRNMVVVPWKRGDVVAIDNYAVAHGRLPYTGRREIAVCWT